MVLGDRAAQLAALPGDVAEAGKAFGPRPFVHVVEELAALLGGARRRDGADHAALADDAGRTGRSPSPRNARHVGDQDRVAQVGLVGAVFQHRFLVGDARKFAGRGDGPAVGEFLEHAGQHRLDRVEHVVLGDEAHLEIELVEFARAAVGAGILVAEAGRDLEIAVEARDHDQLLEHLRRLRERVELARMDPARDQIVARALGAEAVRIGVWNSVKPCSIIRRRIELITWRAQHDVGVDPLAAQVEIAVVEADILRIVLLARHRHRQLLGRRLDRRPRRATTSISPVGSFGLVASGPRATTSPVIVTTNSARRCSSIAQRLAARAGDDLGEPVMVAQIDEQHAAMIALAVDPAGQADALRRRRKRGAGRNCGCDRRAWSSAFE